MKYLELSGLNVWYIERTWLDGLFNGNDMKCLLVFCDA
jgi:hypothetical protein